MTCLSDLAQKRGAVLIAGFLERRHHTSVLHNSVVGFGPRGELLGCHRKLVTAERRWMTPGQPGAGSVWDTPWGRLGMLVCADSFPATPARALALRGADALCVVANWPIVGVSPDELWRRRARENGLPLVAANRAGHETDGLDFSQAPAGMWSEEGEEILQARGAGIHVGHLPLRHGRFAHHRHHALAPRDPKWWPELGLDLTGLTDTTYLWGPVPAEPLMMTESWCRQQLAYGAGRRITAEGHRVATVPAEQAMHPEMWASLARGGVDVAVVDVSSSSAETIEILTYRPLEGPPLVAVDSTDVYLAHLPRLMGPLVLEAITDDDPYAWECDQRAAPRAFSRLDLDVLSARTGR